MFSAIRYKFRIWSKKLKENHLCAIIAVKRLKNCLVIFYSELLRLLQENEVDRALHTIFSRQSQAQQVSACYRLTIPICTIIRKVLGILGFWLKKLWKPFFANIVLETKTFTHLNPWNIFFCHFKHKSRLGVVALFLLSLQFHQIYTEWIFWKLNFSIYSKANLHHLIKSYLNFQFSDFWPNFPKYLHLETDDFIWVVSFSSGSKIKFQPEKKLSVHTVFFLAERDGE